LMQLMCSTALSIVSSMQCYRPAGKQRKPSRLLVVSGHCDASSLCNCFRGGGG
jgi:hypothetical protein